MYNLGEVIVISTIAVAMWMLYVMYEGGDD